MPNVVDGIEATIKALTWGESLKTHIQIAGSPDWEKSDEGKYALLKGLDGYFKALGFLGELSEKSPMISKVVDKERKNLEEIRAFVNNIAENASSMGGLEHEKRFYQNQAAPFFKEAGSVLSGNWKAEESHYRSK